MRKTAFLSTALALASVVLSCGTGRPSSFVETFKGDGIVVNLDRWNDQLYATWERPEVPLFGYAIGMAEGDSFFLELYDRANGEASGRIEATFSGDSEIKGTFSYAGSSFPITLGRVAASKAPAIVTKEILGTIPEYPKEVPSVFRFFSFEPGESDGEFREAFRAAVGDSVERMLNTEMEMFFMSYRDFADATRAESPEAEILPWRYEAWRTYAYRGARFVTTIWQASIKIKDTDSASGVTLVQVVDLESGRRLGLGDVVKEDSLSALCDILTEEAAAMEPVPLEEAGFVGSSVKVTPNFGICEGGLIFHYNMGELGHAEMGERWYMIGWKRLEGLLDEGFVEAFGL